MTPPGIEPATSRLVAQYLNQLPHRVTSMSIIMEVKLRWMSQTELVARVEKNRNVLVGKLVGEDHSGDLGVDDSIT